MAARNRPRALLKEDVDAHEEKDLWTKICNGIKELATMSKRIQEIESELAHEQERLGDGSSRVAAPCYIVTFSYNRECHFFVVLYMFMKLSTLLSHAIISHVKLRIGSNSIFKTVLGQNGNR